MILLDRESFPYSSTARAAHDLAGLLKQVRPEFGGNVDMLQGIATNSHRRLDNAVSAPEIAQAWGDMSAAYQTLVDLRRNNKA